MSEAVDWNDLWVAMQEFGAALQPLLDSGNVPDWAGDLANALDNAEEPIANRALAATETRARVPQPERKADHGRA